jgi:hypothetical protein
VITPLLIGEFFYFSVYYRFGGIYIGCCLLTRTRRLNVNKKPAYSILLGLLIGAIFGLGIGAISGDAVYGMQLGALAGVFTAWVFTILSLQK